MRDGWVEAQLGDVCELSKGTSPTQKTSPGEFPLIVTAAEPLTSGEYQIDGEAVCVPMVSSTGHGHASIKRVHYASGKFAVANIIAACIVKDRELCDTQYLWLYLQHRKDEVIVPRMQGTANVSLSIKELAQVPVSLPPLTEQQRIVDLIGSLDDAIEAAEESAGALDHAYLALLERVNNSGFELRRLESVLSKAKAGGTPSRRVPKNYGGSIPWLKSGEVENDSIITSSESITEFALATSSAWLAPAGATVVAMYGQGDTKGKAGFLLAPVAMNQAVIALVPNEEIIDGRFLFHVMRSRTVSLRKKAVGAAQPNLSKGIVVDEEIPVPPLGAQAGISSMLDSALDSRRLAEVHAASLRNLRTNLLTALLSGAHEIPESYDDQLAEAV